MEKGLFEISSTDDTSNTPSNGSFYRNIPLFIPLLK